MPASSRGPTDRTLRLLARLSDDATTLADRMAQTSIELCAAGGDPAAEIALALAATLLLRLEDAAPRLHLHVPANRSISLPRLADVPLVEALAKEHEGFRSIERLTDQPAPNPRLRLVFGGADGGVPVQVSGWSCAIGQQLPLAPGNVLAAAFAGVLASIEAFKAALISAGSPAQIRPWREVVSLWDLSLSAAAGPHSIEPVDLSGTAMVGCGGIASATAWTLALLPLTGRPILVDHDQIDREGTNLNRHLTASYADLRKDKANLTASLLARAGASPEAHTERWQALPSAIRGTIRDALVTVDDDPTRRAVQLDLPRLILNAGTSDDGLYQVTRHDFVNGACLGCIARADLRSSGPEESAAQRLEIPLDDLRPYLMSSDPLPDELLSRARLQPEERALLADTPGRHLVRRVCAEFRVTPTGPAVSAPMLSAAPGVLLAAEAVKRTLRADTPLSERTNTLMASFLRGPHGQWLRGRVKQPNCDCTEPAYLARFQQKWELG